MRPTNEAINEARLVVACRTHRWSEEIARMARRLQFYCQGVEFVILADESNGVLDTGSLTKIAHSNDFSALGLPNFPERRVLWYNADYPLFVLREVYPHATHYAMIEFDVAVNTDVAAIMRVAQADDLDMIAHEIQDSTPAWNWHETLWKPFAKPMKAFIPFLVVSARAVDAMLLERWELYAQKAITSQSEWHDWPYCEGFIPSVICALPDAKTRELSSFVQLPFFEYRPERHVDDPATYQPGTVCHPVVERLVYVERFVSTVRPESILEPESDVRRQLLLFNPAMFVEKLLERIKIRRSIRLMLKFLDLAREQGWVIKDPFENLALFRPALMSSAYGAGENPDLAVAAQGGNNGLVTGKYGFHSERERSPWWQVDLERDCAVSKVVLFNRMDMAERSRNLRISSSANGKTWVVQGERVDESPFGGIDGNPYVFAPDKPFSARFVRLTLIGNNNFHLDEVEIYGEVLSV